MVFCAAAWIGVQHLGYVEFGMAGRMFVDGVFRRQLNSHVELQTLQEALAAARSPEESWEAIRGACRKLGFTRAELRVNGSHFSDCLVETNGDATWDIHIPLLEGGYVKLTRRFEAEGNPMVLAPLADALRKMSSAVKREEEEAFSASPR